MTSVCYFWIYLFRDHANAPCYFFLQLRCQISPHYPILKGKVSSISFLVEEKKCAHHCTPPTRQQKLLHLQLAGFLTKNFWTCPGQQTKCLYSMEHVAYKQLLTCWEVLFLWNVQKNSSEKEKGFSLRYLLQRQEHNHIPWSQSSKVWEEAFVKCQRSLQSKQLLANAHLIGGAHFILTSYRTSELLKHKVIPVRSLWD